jgi:hypothetical protein
MNKIRIGSNPTILAVALSVIGGISAPVMAVPNNLAANSIQESVAPSLPTQREVQLAQNLIGQCRAANRTVDIFSQASVAPASETLATLQTNSRVTLADNGSAGWIGVSSPTNGYVIARYLKACSGNPPVGTNTCRTANVALSIRPNPNNTQGNQIGTVATGGVVKLTNPEQSQVDSTGRTWIRIVSPLSGWVSSGFPEGNLGSRFSCS